MKNTFTTPLLYKQCRCRRYKLLILSRSFSLGGRKGVISTAITDKVTSTVNYFDRVLGIAEVRAAQSVVTEAEDEFMKSRRNVQKSRTELVQLQSQLHEVRSKLDRIPREDERYLQLATEEHRVLIDQKRLKTDLEVFVGFERDHFSALSGAVRNAHEKERSRAERTKYWSIIGSACGAVLGILGSTVLNIKRMKQIKLTVEENNQSFMTKTLEELRTIMHSEKACTNSPKIISPHKEPAGDDMSQENQRILNEIHGKIDKLLETDLPLLIQQLKVELGGNSKVTLLENSANFIDFESNLWWSKTGLVVTIVTGLSLLYLFYK